MRRILIICCWILLDTGALYAQSVQKKVELNLSSGYEQQNLNWSIAGNQAGQNPDIYSELQWKKLSGQAVSASLQWNIWNRVSLYTGYSRVFIGKGTVSDNDYNGDNRTNEVYNELFNSDMGYSQALSAGAGYAFYNNEHFSLTPYIGYAINKQNLHLLDRTGNFHDLNSTYHADWKGPFIKAIAKLKLANKLLLHTDLTYNQASYNAVADWNLIQTFQHPVSYRHTAKGFGFDGNIGLNYAITKYIAINVAAGYFRWQTGKGVDELFLSSGGSELTQLNQVDRYGYRVTGGIVLQY